MGTYRQIIKNFKKKRILVLGDLILDQHIRGMVSRISPEAPVPVVLQQGDPVLAPGGAANVAANLRGLGARVTLVGRIGPDAEGRLLLDHLKRKKVALKGIFVDRSAPTILKTRILAQHQQVLRLDRERTGCPVTGRALRRLMDSLVRQMPLYDAVIISDYGKGMITEELVARVCSLAREHGSILTVDPKVEHFRFYRGVTAITPNRMEAENAIRDIKIRHRNGRRLDLTSDRLPTVADVLHAGRRLREFMDLDALLVTLGEEGMCLFERGMRPRHIRTRARDVYDVTGAGDSVIAVFTLALTAGATKVQAAELANLAAGVVVGRLGPAGVDPGDLAEALKEEGL